MLNEYYLDKINLHIRYANHLVNANNDNHVVPWRKLFDYELLFVTKGQIIVATNHSKFYVKKNQFHIMPPNIFHTRYFNEGESCDYYNIHLDFFYLPADFSAEDVYTKQYESTPYFVSTIEHRGNFDNVITPNIIDTTHPEVFVSLFEKLYAAYRSNNKIKKIIEMKAHGYALLLNLIN